MSSLRSIISSRINGSLSKGPVTEEGKQRSSQNALRHGLLAQSSVIHGESADAFEDLFLGYVASFDPQKPVELDMIEEMASAYWRMRRLWAIETNMLDTQMALQTAGDPMTRIADSFNALADSRRLDLLNRYEARLHRIYQRCLRNIMLIRKMPSGAPGNLPNEPNL